MKISSNVWGYLEFSSIWPPVTSNDVIIDIWHNFTQYITSEFYENSQTPSTYDLVFEVPTNFLSYLKLTSIWPALTSNDVIHNWHVDISVFTQYIKSEFSENLHTSSPNCLDFGGIIEFPNLPFTSIWTPMISNDVKIDILTYFPTVYHVLCLKVCCFRMVKSFQKTKNTFELL